MNLKEVFRYAVILVPLNLAFPDSTRRQNPKHHFCDCMFLSCHVRVPECSFKN